MHVTIIGQSIVGRVTIHAISCYAAGREAYYLQAYHFYENGRANHLVGLNADSEKAALEAIDAINDGNVEHWSGKFVEVAQNNLAISLA